MIDPLWGLTRLSTADSVAASILRKCLKIAAQSECLLNEADVNSAPFGRGYSSGRSA